MSRINPQIENARHQQNEWRWKDQHDCKNLPGQPGRGQAQDPDKTKQDDPRKIPGQYKRRCIHRQREPTDRAALGPEHGAGGDSEQQKLGVVEAMINGQHGKSRDGRERQPVFSGGWLRAQSCECPYEQQCSANKAGRRIVEARIVPEGAEDRLQVDHHAQAVAVR